MGKILKITRRVGFSCTKTGEDYFTSNTSKYFDEGVKMAIEKMELLGFFWADEEYF